MCPKGFGDFQCSTSLYKKCYINVTDPDLSKGCSENKDTPYYLYSVPGYDPCFHFNFSQSYEIKYKLDCRIIDDTGLVEMQREQTGYEYRDVVEVASFNPFYYVAVNAETEFSINQTSENS